jgi:hypothetical protein
MPTYIVCANCIVGDHTRHRADDESCETVVWNPLQASEMRCACAVRQRRDLPSLGEFGRAQGERVASQVVANQRTLSVQEFAIAPCRPCGNSRHAKCAKPRTNRCCCL